ncbi:FCD domain-containing protein [Pseudonocardia alaniniphila]|uniref:FCD domain-containing protein n=2 Tax=Pseudonocardia alaniniphila TaxID=75291 RepID=A0ABS9TS30_9PSEU|nr:FCD domain-containing protein [Pseudonocardia alaniniphila]
MAVELGVPVHDPQRLVACHEALARTEQNARDKDCGPLVENGYAFHSPIVALAGHRRLSEMYRPVQQQVLLCMSRKLSTRERFHENLMEHAARYRHLLELIEAGEPPAVLAELAVLAVHGERSFAEH